jgi:DNA-binding response OmpR family regulator
MRELLARVRALLRRRQLIREEFERRDPANDRRTLTAGDLEIDTAGHTVLLRGEPVVLTPKEFALLETLVRNRGQVMPPGQLLELVWGYSDVDTRTVAVHIRTLRTKIEPDPSHPVHIETVRGVGYRFKP